MTLIGAGHKPRQTQSEGYSFSPNWHEKNKGECVVLL